MSLPLLPAEDNELLSNECGSCEAVSVKTISGWVSGVCRLKQRIKIPTIGMMILSGRLFFLFPLTILVIVEHIFLKRRNS
jgi:hypothetical protein